MSLQTYLNAIEKIENDPLSFLFCSQADKSERQLAKFKHAVQQRVQLTAAGVESDGENQDSGGN